MKLEQKGDPAVAERNETKREKGDLKNSAHKSVDVPCSTDSRRQAASNKTKPLKPKMSKEGPDVQQEEHVANELNTFSGSAQKAETDSDENLNGEDEEDDEYDESDSDVNEEEVNDNEDGNRLKSLLEFGRQASAKIERNSLVSKKQEG